MAGNDENTREQQLYGQALRTLREELGISQEEAGKNVRPAMTKQAWGMHEAGKIKGILTPQLQRRLAGALGATRETLILKRDQIERIGFVVRPMKRGSRSLADPGRDYDDGVAYREAVFPLSSGQLTLTYPARLTAAMVEEMAGFLALFLQTQRAQTADA